MPLNYQGKLKEYAAIVGKAESSMYENRKAAEVLRHFTEKIRTCEFPQNAKIRTCEFLGKPHVRRGRCGGNKTDYNCNPFLGEGNNAVNHIALIFNLAQTLRKGCTVQRSRQ